MWYNGARGPWCNDGRLSRGGVDRRSSCCCTEVLRGGRICFKAWFVGLMVREKSVEVLEAASLCCFCRRVHFERVRRV